MLFNLLSADPTRAVSIGESALYALLGFTVVFVGIAFLIFVVWAIGKIMVKFNGVKESKEKKAVTKTEVANDLAVSESVSEEISEETVAVITAALMAYYQKNNPKCEFTVKRIKRI
ncbi:MAG: OadG family protein [Clostridia bacterium]|nr:OadG family protein [Clostridia bacterium]